MKSLFKKRVVRILLITVVVLGFTGWFAFTTFLFSPLEDDYPGRLAGLVPRGVDFYVAKAGLSEDFAGFPPRLLAEEREAGPALVRSLAEGRTLAAQPGIEALLQTDAARAWLADPTLAGQLRGLERALEGLPIAIDLLQACGGREIACAGRFGATADFAAADWAVYARLNWIGKLGVSLLRYPDVLQLEAHGLAVAEEEGVFTLSGADLPRPLAITRIRDVLIVSPAPALLAEARSLESSKGQDSFGQSARYSDSIDRQGRDGRELEIYVDLRKALEKSGAGSAGWPDSASQDLLVGLAGRFFQRALINEVEGTIDFQRSAAIDLHAELSTELMTGTMKRLYRSKGLDKAGIRQAAKFAPADAVLVAHLSIDFGDLMRSILESAEPAMRNNFDDLVRSVWGYPDASRLIEEFDAALEDHVLLIARPNDYPDEGQDGPPHDDSPVFAWTVVLGIQAPEKIEELRNKVINNPSQFGLAGRTSGGGAVWTNPVEGGSVVTEYWTPFVPGTGHLASVTTGGGESKPVLMVSNAHQMLGHVLSTYYQRGPRYVSLDASDRFTVMADNAAEYASLFLWIDPRGAAATLRRQALRDAQGSVSIDWKSERPRIDGEVLARSFGGRGLEQLSAEEQAEFERLSQEAADAYEAQVRLQQAPGALAEIERRLRIASLCSGALVELGLDPKELDLTARLFLPLDSGQGD